MSALQKNYIYDCIGLLLFVFIYKVRAIPFYEIHIVLQNRKSFGATPLYFCRFEHIFQLIINNLHRVYPPLKIRSFLGGGYTHIYYLIIK